jgi:hypothetical protein
MTVYNGTPMVGGRDPKIPGTIGATQGTIYGKMRPTAGTFPYTQEQESMYEPDDFDEDVEDEDVEAIRSKVRDIFKTDFIKRADHGSFTKLGYGTVQEFNFRSGMSPLAGYYGNFDGPPIGAGGTNNMITTRPGAIGGDYYEYTSGLNKAVDKEVHTPSYKFSVYDFLDEDYEFDQDMINLINELECS